MVYQALYAAFDLERQGISCAVVNGRFIKPMDREVLVNLAGFTKRVFTIEENTVVGGFGSGVMEVLSEEGIEVPVTRMGVPDRFLSHGSQKGLREACGLDKDGIEKKVKACLETE